MQQQSTQNLAHGPTWLDARADFSNSSAEMAVKPQRSRGTTRRGRLQRGLALAAACLITPFGMTAQAGSDDSALYRWTDGDGVVRYSPHRNRVPVSQRSSMERVEIETLVAAEPEPVAELVHHEPAPTPTPEPVETPTPELVSEPVAHHEPAPTPQPSPTVGSASRHPDANVWAVQISAVPASTDVELPTLSLPDGTRLYRAPLLKDGTSWERVRVGFFASEAEALAAATRLDAEFPGAWVAQVDSDERLAASLPSVDAAPLVIRDPLPEPVARKHVEARYAIQLRAVPLADGPTPLPLLELQGFRLYRSTVQLDGEVWERLRLGFFTNRAAAQDKLGQLGLNFPGAWVVRVSPSERVLARTASMPRSTELPTS
ncbi:MAG: SPOR domain-containing protein [Myxococcota bacterium]